MSPSMHVVFLQGMPSSFFSRIGAGLTKLGCKVTGINLCAGDALFWKGGNKVSYRGRRSKWPAFFADFIEQNQVTDLVLLGEQRDYHKEAVAVAKKKNVRVTVTDFGYLRPDWITLEQDGMSANSKFPRQSAEISKLAANTPKADLTIKYHDHTFNMAVGDLAYSFSSVLLFWLYPFYRQSYKRAHPAVYFPAIGWRLLTAKSRNHKAVAHMEKLDAAKTPYFIFPLQLKHDFQIIAYSPFDQVEDALELTIKSFSLNAPKGAHLVFKIHPWDPGFTNWRRKIAVMAQKYGIAERVDYVEGGNLGDMIRNSLGMVTINSTSAIQSLLIGRPLLTLGESVYNVTGLTYQNGIDKYWNDLTPPDPQLVSDFINAIAALIQIRGVFFSEPGLTCAVEEATKRIHQQKVGMAAA